MGLTQPQSVLKLDPARGFLPTQDPLTALPASFTVYDKMAAALPSLIPAGRVREALADLPELDTTLLHDDAAVRRAMMLFSYFGQAYVWGEAEAAQSIPASIAVPWVALAKRVGRPPILSYASYALDNWRRIDADGPIALGNIELLQNFLGGADEDWFILVHVEIEALAAPALARLPEAVSAAAQDRTEDLVVHLEEIAAATERMCATLNRMPEWCDPYIYFNRVRPYIHGWKDHPALPQGVVYEGVEEYGGEPQALRGETGAQSAIVPCLDAALGIGHVPDPLRQYLVEMRGYMPPEHRAFRDQLEEGMGIREYVAGKRDERSDLAEAYDACLQWLGRFRAIHLDFADRYIHRQAKASANNPTDVGTGGTPFMHYLEKHRAETLRHRVG
jgi:indoleamine 2,3-dioxygenase